MRSTNVAVAEWLRRQTVNLSMRVQFPPATPSVFEMDCEAARRGRLPLQGEQQRSFESLAIQKGLMAVELVRS
jgi:hypothetical protein